MIDQKTIERVREQAMALEPDMRGMVIAMADSLERVWEEKKREGRHLMAGKEAKPEPGRLVHILGAVWTIKERSESEDERLKDCDGYCDWTTREIVVEREVCGNLGDMEKYIRKVTRHEIVHAFLLESGLHECAGEVCSWAANEEMVDWIARQGQRIYAAWKEAGALDV